jgi:signal transduction histidine kinase
MSETDPRRILFPVRVPDWMGSVRFRLTVIYSLILFGLAAAVVGGIYLGLAASLDDEPVHQSMPVHIVEVTPVPGGVVIEGNQGTAEMRSLEEEVNQRALDVLRTYSFGALGLLFVASLGVGWIVAGRALAPIHRITKVARNIQATDLKRRIHLGGPPDELRELADTFDEMLTRIDEAFEGQRRFIHEASHELRNPLAVIRTNLDVAMADPDASVDDLRETGAIVQNAAGRMTHLVDDLLLYARQEVPSYDVAPIDVSDLVAMAAAEFRAPAEARSIAVESASEPDLWVTGDRVALRQALANLLANAVRLAPEGGQIRVAAGRQTGWIWMAVEDQGPGIAEEDQAAVFQRFWRGEDPPGRRGTRSGLGLSIVRQIAEAHHGEVRLTSTEGVGSTFSLWLPTAVRPVPEREQVPDPPARETPEPAR